MNFICGDTEDNSPILMAQGKSGFDKSVTQIAAITAKGTTFYNNGNVKEFLKWVLQRPEVYIYFHNLQYDLGNLFGDEIDELDCTLVAGRMIKAVWGKKIFVDSFNIWPMAAKKLGEAFGLSKLEFQGKLSDFKTELEYQLAKADFMANNKDYVFRDVEIIRRAMSFAWEFALEMGLDNLPPTLGGLCVKLWKHWGGVNAHDSTMLSRSALFGGRVELFKVINDSKNICWTDVNSLYPAVMRNEYPEILEPWCYSELPDYGIATVSMHVPKCEIAPLPFRNEEDRILYPYGKFTGTWTVAEIKNAVENGSKILKVHEVIGTNEYSRPYKEYVEKLYAMRLETKSEAESLFFKLLMNNLYGRLGTAGMIGRTVYQTEENRDSGIPFGCKVLANYQMPLSLETNWSHAAYVTAYGRITLYQHMKLIGAENMIYCDTDSTVFDCDDKKIPFEVGSGLGIMKLEGWEKFCQTYAPKMYEVEGWKIDKESGKKKLKRRFKAKGVPQRLAKDYIRHGQVEFDLPFKFREAVAFFDKRIQRNFQSGVTLSK